MLKLILSYMLSWILILNGLGLRQQYYYSHQDALDIFEIVAAECVYEQSESKLDCYRNAALYSEEQAYKFLVQTEV